MTDIFKKKIFSIPLILFVFISCIGLFNSTWYSLILYHLLFLLFFSARIIFKKKKWILVAFLIPITILTKLSLEVPKIIQGSNVFIGGVENDDNIFKKKLPKIIYNKLNRHFLTPFQDQI